MVPGFTFNAGFVGGFYNSGHIEAEVGTPGFLSLVCFVVAGFLSCFVCCFVVYWRLR